MPADVIYAGTLVAADGIERPAAISLGRCLTFYEHADMSLLEAFVLDWSGDLYGQIARVAFHARLRGGALRTASRRSSPRCTMTSPSPGAC